MAHWQYQGRAQPVSFSPPVVVPFVEPTIIFDKTVIYQSYAVAPFVPPAFTEFWFTPFSEPKRSKPVPTHHPALAWTFAEYDDLRREWYSPLSEPKPQRSKSRAPWFDFDAQGNLEPIVSFSWYNNLSTHPGQKKFPASQQQPTLAWSTFTPSEFSEWWYTPLSEPVRFKQPMRQHITLAWTFADYDDLSRAWYSPFSEPKRDKPRAQNQQELAWSTFTPAAAAFTEFWFSPFSEPKRERRAQQQQALAWVFAQYDDLTKAWFSPLAEPVRYRRFGVAYQPVTTIDVKPTVSFGWYNWLHDPIRVPRRLPPALNQEFAIDVEPTVSFSWYGWLHDPVRFRRFPTAEQQAFTSDTSVQVDPRDIKWYFPWTDPVRVARRLAPALNQEFATDLDPIVSFGWFGALTEPVRVRVSLRTAINPFIVSDTRPTVSFSWYGNLSEPKRFRRGLRADEQQVGFFDPFPPRVNIGWFGPLSNPVLPKARYQLQRSFAGPERLLVTPIILTMAVTEENNDRAQFALSIYNRAASARVSIEEIPFRDDAAISIREP